MCGVSVCVCVLTKQNSSRENHNLPWENYLGKDAAKCVLLTAKCVNLEWMRITYFCGV